MIDCKHLKSGKCELGLYGGSPSHGVCKQCKNNTSLLQSTSPNEPEKSKGLGDTVSKVIKAVTGGKIKECGGCKARREALNRLLPYTDPDKK